MAQDVPRPSGGRAKSCQEITEVLTYPPGNESISHPNGKVGKIIKQQVRDGICEFPGKGICPLVLQVRILFGPKNLHAFELPE